MNPLLTQNKCVYYHAYKIHFSTAAHDKQAKPTQSENHQERDRKWGLPCLQASLFPLTHSSEIREPKRKEIFECFVEFQAQGTFQYKYYNCVFISCEPIRKPCVHCWPEGNRNYFLQDLDRNSEAELAE